jgi:hypothetical protein
MICAYDEQLLKKEVFFLPWIGDSYTKGFKGRKLLILGESHYTKWKEGKVGQAATHVLDNEFTRDCIKETINRDDHSNTRLWKNIEKSLLNQSGVPWKGSEENWTMDGGRPFWERLAFYNFVQSPVEAGSRQAPIKEQFQKSFQPFRAVLDALAPERVWVCGKRLWNHMNPEDVRIHKFVYAYRSADGNLSWCLATDHPAAPTFSWRREHPRLMAFLEDPKKAEELLETPPQP